MSLGPGWVSEHHVICVIGDRIGYVWPPRSTVGAAALGGSCLPS